jgi:glutathione S-transferase
MITLFGIPGTAATAPHMVLEDIGVDYEFVLVERDEEGRSIAPPAFLAISPFGKVPALVHDDLELTEAAAICLHLAASFPDADLLPAPGDAHRAHVVRWLMTLTNTVQPAYLRHFYTDRYTTDPASIPAVNAAAVRELTELRDYFVRELGDGPFLLGERYSVADAYLAMLSSWGTDLPEGSRWWEQPALARHYDAVLARPACRRAVEHEGGSLTSGA